MHAFGSTLPGLRSQHLGFHRALCLLMGWNSAAALNASWGCETLPDAEIMAIKEDLIIWPPVVIVHNSSIENSDPAHRFIVSSESLKDYLRDHGFQGGNAKVCHGKPANQSILVVTFSGTFSGLQEAERLHKFYAENKHGRAELQEGHGAATQAVVGDKVKDVLYGFLGLAGDLDKLEFETKKRCVVRSKKDIQAIADAAPINMDSVNP